MSLENETKQTESPLEKAKRLKAEKEARDGANAEAEAEKQATAQAKTEKLGTLNSHKQDLENQLNEIDIKIEASKGEAHETRDTMQEAGLDKDSEFKDEYDLTISEVAGNLNGLRNERNEIKTKLEQINLEIENFGINEAVSEGKKETQEAVSSADQENEEAISQVKNYPGAEAGDIKTAEEVAAETSGKINQTVENSEKTVNELVNNNEKIEKGEAQELKEFKDFKDFFEKNTEGINGSKGLSANEFLKNYLSEKYPKMDKDSQEYNDKWTGIALASKFNNINESPYIKSKYSKGLDFEEFKNNRKELTEKSNLFNVIGKVKAQMLEKKTETQEYQKNIIEKIKSDEKYKNEFTENFKNNGFKAGDSELINNLYAKGLISIDDVAKGLAIYEKEGISKLRNLSPAILENLNQANINTGDGQKLPFKILLDKYAKDENTHPSLETKNWPEMTLAYAAPAAFATRIAGKRFSNELAQVWNENFKQLTDKIVAKGPECAADLVKNLGGNLEQSILTDKRLKIIVGQYAKHRFGKIGGNNGEMVAAETSRRLENLVEAGVMTREEIDNIYERALE